MPLGLAHLRKYFVQKGTDWYIQDEIRQLVQFRRVNLAHSWEDLPSMDLVFLRNVLGSFAPDTWKQIIEQLSELLSPGGYLIESEGGESHPHRSRMPNPPKPPR